MTEPMFTGDLEPNLVVTLKDKTGAPLDATGAELIMVGVRAGVTVFTDATVVGVLVTGATVVTRQWVAGETDLPGRITIWVRVIWPDDRPQTFRPMGSVNVLPAYDYVHVPTP